MKGHSLDRCTDDRIVKSSAMVVGELEFLNKVLKSSSRRQDMMFSRKETHRCKKGKAGKGVLVYPGQLIGELRGGGQLPEGAFHGGGGLQGGQCLLGHSPGRRARLKRRVSLAVERRDSHGSAPNRPKGSALHA